MIRESLENKFQILCGFNVLVYILKEFLRGHTGIYLGGSYIGMSQHLADGSMGTPFSSVMRVENECRPM